jgi:SPP1 gp7 family putative phage head morphogenesis protein
VATVGAIALLRAARALNRPHQRAAGGRFRARHALRRRVPKQRYPSAIESSYAAAIIRAVQAARAAVVGSLLPELAELLDSARASRQDAIDATDRVGLRIVVENQVGSVRKWADADGTEGETVMRHAYGYVDGARGADGEGVDVYLGPLDDPEWVFVVHQMRKSAEDVWTEYDEDKVMLGWASANDAMNAYLAQYEDDRFYGGMSVFRVEDFKQVLRDAGIELGYADVGKITHEQRLDAGESRRARLLLDRARAEVDRAFNVRDLESIAERFGTETTRYQGEHLKRQARAALGVDIATADRSVPGIIDSFVGENVSLITTMNRRTFDDVERLVTRSFTSGLRHEELAQQISARFGVAERHARLIARDQIGKISGQVNAARQKELGIRRFTWRTVGDERVRDEHKDLNGQVFSFDDPPSEGLPGEPINCRCSAEPVFDDVLDEIADDPTPPDPMPSRASDIADEDEVRTVDARDILDRGYFEPIAGLDMVKLDKARRAIAEGQRDPVKITVGRNGKYELTDGRHRLRAAIEAQMPVKVQFEKGGPWVGAGEGMTFRGGERQRPANRRRARRS